MTNFENIQVGDKVLIPTARVCNKTNTFWRVLEQFEVTRVTKTQFVTKLGNVRKADGKVIGFKYKFASLEA